MAGFVEFYISCNPPLLPGGVSLVVSKVYNALESKVIEILYEPEVPWFKVITVVEDQAEVTEWVQYQLEQLLEEETGPVDEDPGQEDDDTVGNTSVRTDVEILAEVPHLIPWPLLYDEQQDGSLLKYDAWRYPEDIKKFPHKTVWRGLERLNRLTISDFLAKYDFLRSASDPELSLEKFAELANCQMSHNLQGNLVYIGCDTGSLGLEAVTHKLDNLLNHVDVPFTKTTHLIFTEEFGPSQVSYRWLTHTGLAHLTYLDPSTPDQDQEYKRIAGAVSLRAVDTRGRSGNEKPMYSGLPEPSIDSRADFSPFAGHMYPNKRSGTTAIDEEDKRLPETPRRLGQDTVKKPGQPPKKPTAGSEKNITKNLKGIKAHDKKPPFAISAKLPVDTYKQAREIAVKPKQRHRTADSCTASFSRENSEPFKGPRSQIPTQVSVENWMEGVEVDGTTADELELIPQLTDAMAPNRETTRVMRASSGFADDDMLLDLRPSSQVLLHTGPQQAFSNDMAGQPQLLEFKDFSSLEPIPPPQTPKRARTQCLLDSESPKREFHGMFAVVDHRIKEVTNHQGGSRDDRRVIPPGENLMDYLEAPISTPALMDGFPRMNSRVFWPRTGNTLGTEDDDANAVFGKQTDKRKEVFRTMKQQASPGPSWANVASTKKKPDSKEETITFGQNVRVTVVPERLKPSSPKKSAINDADINKRGPSVNQGKGVQQTTRRLPGPEFLSDGIRTVPGMDPVPMAFVECVEVVERAEKELQNLLRMLQVTPGKLRLEANFGRLCIKNLVPSLVNIGEGPSWFAPQVLEDLNTDGFEEEHMGFYTILTTSGAEANLIPKLAACKAAWMLKEKQVTYDFVCVSNQHSSSFVVKVDADTFKYECLPVAQEMSRLHVHCVQRAWDVQFTINRTSVDALPEDLKGFAASLVRSLNISTGDTGEIEIDADQDCALGWCVQGVNIRHLAKYRNGGKGRSCLTITMTRVLKRFPAARNTTKAKYRGHTIPTTVPGEGPLTQWFEAGISSTRVEEVFKENVGLEFGEKVHWTPEKLKEDRVLTSICEPALRMVSQMDRVGRSNRNGQGPRTDRRIHDTIKDSKDRDASEPFW
ncbi:hypothetical protein FZEAL_5472 [Fusarium zealandicum]|uniref:Uncharacterized protein n=1 Tax=Fusarium zealandicum TaxID=1053134 RepID=A0A8H4XJS5_9HYPO|nr:hypothetical protein FZEAL_5472 [Fusarium zealandicum]